MALLFFYAHHCAYLRVRVSYKATMHVSDAVIDGRSGG